MDNYSFDASSCCDRERLFNLFRFIQLHIFLIKRDGGKWPDEISATDSIREHRANSIRHMSGR